MENLTAIAIVPLPVYRWFGSAAAAAGAAEVVGAATTVDATGCG